MIWTRGKTLGSGGSSMVSLATVVSPTTNGLPSVMAVKSAPIYESYLLCKERELHSKFEGCPCVLCCFGDDITMDAEGEHWCNIWLEYAAGGSLADRIQSFGRGLPESKVRPYTKSVLLGLSYIHKKGYVHCDIKPHNILLADTNDDLSMSVSGNRRVKESIAKIADLGLAKKARQRQKGKGRLRGTALYMAPESIQDEQYDSHTDIWALGCTVLQMMTSKEPWEYGPDTEREDILLRIGFTEDMPEIPRDLSKEAQDFLKKCLVRDPKSRWTADMLLGHPFVSVADSAFTRSIEDKRNRLVLPKTAKAVLN